MNLKLRHLLSKRTINRLSRLNPVAPTSSTAIFITSKLINNQNASPPFLSSRKFFHSSPELNFSAAQTAVTSDADDGEDSAAMNEFLSRFVHKMRRELNEAYPDCEKQTVDAMLMVIVEKLVAQMEKGQSLKEMEMSSSKVNFSDDLWQTVLEVSNAVSEDMEREKKKERMQKFLQHENVKALSKFASEIGIRGDLLRELRFKWAREAMEESEFYEKLERFRREALEEDEGEQQEAVAADNVSEAQDAGGGNGGLPKRHGKIKYKIYGLDLSDPKWQEVADRIHDTEEVIWPQEAKPVTGKSKVVTEKVLATEKDDDLMPLLPEWKELVQPSRVDWISLLEKLKEKDVALYLKVGEHVLSEPSFKADIPDYSRLIDIHAKENRLEDVERIREKMIGNGMAPDIIILTALFHMYSKAGKLVQAEETFETLKSQGFKPGLHVYSSMIMAYVNAGKVKEGDSLLTEMETLDMKPAEDVYLALLRGYARRGDVKGAHRIEATMVFAGYQPTLEFYSLLVEAYARSSKPNDARDVFDYMMRLGFKPDDKCTAMVISAYEKGNELDKALHLLLQLEKEKFEPGISTYCVLVDWLGKLQLIDEAEQILEKIAQLGEAPPFKIQVSLCDMYSRAHNEKKALQFLGVLEAKNELLEAEDFERVIQGLIKGGFLQEALRMRGLMEAQGHTVSEAINLSFNSAQTFNRGSKLPGVR